MRHLSPVPRACASPTASTFANQDLVDRHPVRWWLASSPQKFHPTPSQEGAYRIQDALANGLDEYAVSLKRVMDPVWQREFPDAPETTDDSLHVGERGRRLLQADRLSRDQPEGGGDRRVAMARSM